jgi:alkylhydroperoxidase/carboxymuconolactone decarboxylase family protein YurZ
MSPDHPGRVRCISGVRTSLVPWGCGEIGARARTDGRNQTMTQPTRAEVDEMTKDALMGLSAGDIDLLAEGLEYRERWRETSGLDPRSFAIAKIAALIALDAPPASYQWQVENAVAAGVSPKDILGVLFAIAPQVGGPRVVAAAPEIMLALGLPLPGEPPDVDSAI